MDKLTHGHVAGSWSMPSWPVFDDEDIAAVAQVLRSGKVNYWTGEIARRFEREFAQRFGTRYAIALANGTVALELALYALGIGSGDEVITTCRTFIASASAVVMRGAIPVLADVDPVSQNMTAATIAKVLSPRTRAIIAVHLAGWPCEMDAIMDLARANGLKVIEDCARLMARHIEADRWAVSEIWEPFPSVRIRSSLPVGKGGCSSPTIRPYGKHPGPTKITARVMTLFTARIKRQGFSGCTNLSAPIGA